jgi:hypothetical protein
MIRSLKRRASRQIARLAEQMQLLENARKASRRTGRPVADLAKEERTLRRHGLTTEELVHLGVDADSVSLEEKLTYLPTDWHAAHRIWQKFVPEHRRSPFHNKYLFNRFFEAEGLPVARRFGYLDSDFGRLDDGCPLKTERDLSDWMRDRSANGPPETGFVIKPVEGYKGHAIHVFERRAPGDYEAFVTLDGNVFTAERLYADTAANPDVQELGRQVWTRSFLLEERMVPHADLQYLIGPTFCTVRIVTYITRSGFPAVLGAILKIMPGRIGVDHTSRGAVGSWIDIDTGTLNPGRLKGSVEVIDAVPGTDQRFVGFALPYWHEVQEAAFAAQMAFPWARAIGWDIGIADSGPVIIEGNEWWSMVGLQRSAPRGLFDGEFKAVFDSL